MHLTGVFPLQCSGFAIFSDSIVQKAIEQDMNLVKSYVIFDRQVIKVTFSQQ